MIIVHNIFLTGHCIYIFVLIFFSSSGHYKTFTQDITFYSAH